MESPFGKRCKKRYASFGEVVIDAYKLGAFALVSEELLEDSAFDLEGYLKRSFGESLGGAEEEAFVSGDGLGKPLGILHQAQVGAVSEEAEKICMDDIVALYYSLKRPYRENAVWVMSEEAYAALLKIKTYNGRNLWLGNYAESEPTELLGRPIYTCKSMEGVAENTRPVLFGDFRYFCIADRGKRSFKRLDERYADKGQVAFVASQRVDAKLLLPEAVKVLQIRA